MKKIDLLFNVPTMSCVACADTIGNHLTHIKKSPVAGNSFTLVSYSINVQLKTLRISIEYADTNPMPQRMIEILKLDDTGHEFNFSAAIQVQDKQITKDRTHLMGSIIGLGFGLFFMLSSLGLIHFVFMTSWSFILTSNIVLIALAMPFVKHAWLSLKVGIKNFPKADLLNMDSLFVMTGLIVVISSVASLWNPIFSNLLQAGFLIFGFRHLGCMVQAFLHQKMGMTDSLTSVFKDSFYRLADEDKAVLANNLAKGMRIVLAKGEVLPVDAQVVHLSSDAEIKNTLHDGGYLATTYSEIPNILSAGVEVCEGEICLEVLSDIEHSRLGFIDAAIEKMRQEQHSNLLNQVNRALQWFIPMILLLAVSSGLMVAHFFNLALAIKCVTAVLVSACPCTLGLIIPMALRLGAYRAIDEKVIFQSAEALEAAAQAHTFVIDYNGTLTNGEPIFNDFVFFDHHPGISKIDCLHLIAYMEKQVLQTRPEHRFVNAILKQVQSELGTDKLELTHASPEFEDKVYKSLLKIQGQQFLLGNNQMLAECGLEQFARPQAIHFILQREHQQPIYLGYLQEQDNLRPEAKKFVENLLARRKQVTICTGADATTAEKIRQELCGDSHSIEIKANCRVQDKLAYVQSLQRQQNRAVVMIGDAINDKAAMEVSDLGIWFKSQNMPAHWGDNLLCQSAHMVVYSETLMGVLKGMDIAARTYQVIYQNLAFSLFYNLLSLSLACGVLLSFGISLHPALGVGLMILQSALLGVNTWYGICHKDYGFKDDFSLNARAPTKPAPLMA